MKLPRRQFLHLAAGAAALPAVSGIARAQAYPSRQVTIIVGFPVGGGIDIDARLMAQWLSDRLGQPFKVENRTGSGSAVATEAVVRAPADGYTLLFATAANALGPALYPNLKYDFIRDTAPVAGVAFVPIVMVVGPSSLSKPSPTSWPMPRPIQPRPQSGRRSPDHQSSWRRRCSRP
jgi:tripartite-type tricarboxylate transporter receptor subunit TctC